MDLDALRRDVQDFRDALDTCHPKLDQIIFGKFPRGCCGVTAELLLVFLNERGHGAFTYVCGIRYEDGGGPSSHAWLERDGIVVDVTRDQFNEDGEPALVTDDRSWHDNRFPDQQRMGEGDLGEWSRELCDAYAELSMQIDLQNGSR